MASTIKVDNVQNQPGTNIVNKCGTTTTIGAGAGETINVCAATVNIGRCGGTVALAAGATQTGFGRTGTVDWQTTPKTATFSAVSGEGYFCNTSGGAFTVNLPAGSAGAIVSVADYTRTFQTNNLTITPNGSEKVGGVASNFVAQTEGQSITLVYVDATEGWINTAESTGQSGLLPAFVTATGGTPTTVGDYKIHTFTGPGTFTVCSVGNPLGSTTVDYMVVAGGGGGGGSSVGGCYAGGGGGGAGGWRASSGTASGSYTAGPSPLTGCVSALPVSATGYPIVVGGGGAASSNTTPGGTGSVSSFSTIPSAGGGYGGRRDANGGPGGSGGGGGGNACTAGGTGNSPPVSPAQGSGAQGGNGGPGGNAGSGGGGATAGGLEAIQPSTGQRGGQGGAGATSNINNTPTGYAGGGGGGTYCNSGGGGLGGGSGGPAFGAGNGGNPPANGVAGTANTGGGAGGASTVGPDATQRSGGAGGSGIVIIRYKFQ